jgi:hypothetical protein
MLSVASFEPGVGIVGNGGTAVTTSLVCYDRCNQRTPEKIYIRKKNKKKRGLWLRTLECLVNPNIPAVSGGEEATWPLQVLPISEGWAERSGEVRRWELRE